MTAVKGPDVTVTDVQGAVVTVVSSASTVVTTTAPGTLADITPNEAVTVIGPQNADGTYNASRIVVGGLGGLFGRGGQGTAAA